MSRVSTAAALAAGAMALVAAVPGGASALAPGAVGLALLAFGVRRASTRAVTAGTLLLFSGVIVAGVGGLPPGLALLGTLFAIVAWDAATFRIELDDQLGESAETGRAEAVHVGATLAAGGAIASLAYLAAVLSTGRLSPLAAIAIVAGAWLLAMGLEPLADPDVPSP